MLSPPPAVAAALLDTMDGLSRGLNHALSNRVNTLNTLLAVLAEMPGRDPEVDEALQAEEARFEALLHLYRLMPLEGSGASEPMVLADPVTDAAALFGNHLDLRMLPCTVTGLETAPPVRSRRQTLTQAILVMMVAVGRALAGGDEAKGLTLALTFDDDDVRLRATASRPAHAADESACVAFDWLAASIGAQASHGSDEDGRPWAMMVLPTLAAERRRGR